MPETREHEECPKPRNMFAQPIPNDQNLKRFSRVVTCCTSLAPKLERFRGRAPHHRAPGVLPTLWRHVSRSRRRSNPKRRDTYGRTHCGAESWLARVPARPRLALASTCSAQASPRAAQVTRHSMWLRAHTHLDWGGEDVLPDRRPHTHLPRRNYTPTGVRGRHARTLRGAPGSCSIKGDCEAARGPHRAR